jgi:immunity protein Imm5 of predicted polymorphic toxin system
MNANGLPEDIAARVDRAHKVLESRPDGRLPLPERRAIRELFGPWQAEPDADALPGLRRRYALSRASAEHVLPVWKAEAPDDEKPERMLALADAVLERRVDARTAIDESQRVSVEIGDLAGDGQISQSANAAGQAACTTVVAAAAGDYGEDVPPDTDDNDLEPDEWEAEFEASFAVTDYPNQDPEDLRAYWRWYLDEAVPAAWQSG